MAGFFGGSLTLNSGGTAMQVPVASRTAYTRWFQNRFGALPEAVKDASGKPTSAVGTTKEIWDAYVAAALRVTRLAQKGSKSPVVSLKGPLYRFWLLMDPDGLAAWDLVVTPGTCPRTLGVAQLMKGPTELVTYFSARAAEYARKTGLDLGNAGSKYAQLYSLTPAEKAQLLLIGSVDATKNGTLTLQVGIGGTRLDQKKPTILRDPAQASDTESGSTGTAILQIMPGFGSQVIPPGEGETPVVPPPPTAIVEETVSRPFPWLGLAVLAGGGLLVWKLISRKSKKE